MNRILALYIFLLLCGTVSAQQIVEWSDLQTITDNSRRTVYYKKGRKQPLRGKYRIIRGLDEECVKFSDGMINGDYRDTTIWRDKNSCRDGLDCRDLVVSA